MNIIPLEADRALPLPQEESPPTLPVSCSYYQLRPPSAAEQRFLFVCISDSLNSLSMSTSELACTYAALILAEDEIPATADKINAIVTAAGITVEPFWPPLFAKFLDGKSAVDLVSAIGSGAWKDY